MLTIQVPVTTYIYKYVWHHYGPGDRFNISLSRQNALRIALEHLNFDAWADPFHNQLPGRYIHLQVDESDGIRDIIDTATPWLRAGYFYQQQFNHSLHTYIDAQRDLARAHRLKETEWNARLGLERFLQKYNIEEHEYSYESLRRQYNRVNQDKWEFFRKKLYAEFEFCMHDSVPNDGSAYSERLSQQIKPCRLIKCDGLMIYFNAYSRSRRQVHRLQIRVPRRLIQSEEHWEWIDIHFRIINGYLKRGYTIK